MGVKRKPDLDPELEPDEDEPDDDEGKVDMVRDRGANERVAGRTGAAVAVRRSNVCRHGDVRERRDAMV